MAELADALDSKSSDRKIVWVRAPPPANSPLHSAASPKDLCVPEFAQRRNFILCSAEHFLSALSPGAFGIAPTALTQVACLQGDVLGTDGRPLQRAEIRLEAKDKASAPITTITGSGGRYLFAALPVGVYKLSILADGAVKFSVDIKMRGEKARLDFDLSTSARKDKKLCLGSRPHRK